MAAIGKVSAVFTASTSGLTAGVKAASSSFRSLQSDTQGLSSNMRALVAINGAQLFGSIASSAAAGVRSLLSFAQGQADIIDNASKLAARLGMNYGEFAGLSLAADLAGVSMETVGKASQKAEIAFANASNGSATATAAFGRLGLSVEQLGQMSAADRFDAIAGAIAALPTEAERAAAAVGVFGKAGAELLPLFAGGAEGIAQAREQAERLGLVLTNAQGQDVEAMNDAFTMVEKSIAGVVQQVVAYLSPAIKSVFDTFVEFVGTMGGANIGKAIGDGILTGARFLASIGDYVIQNFGSTFSYLSNVGNQWGTVFAFGQSVASAFVGAFKIFEFVGNIIGGVISDIVAMLLQAASDTAALIPGFGGTADGLKTAADYMATQADNYLESANNSLAASGQAFSAAFSGSAPQIGQAIAGPLVTSLDEAVARANQSAASVDQARSATPQVEQAVRVDVSEAIKGIDSRSSAGVAEMFRLMRGTTGDVQQQQLSVLEQIADNTSGDDFTVVEGF